MRRTPRTLGLELRNVDQGPTDDGVEHLVLHTDEGDVPCRMHPAEGSTSAVVWVGGAGGGLDGPAGGMYPRLAGRLVGAGIASLRLHYRRPNDFVPCVRDTLLGVAYLGQRDYTRCALVGHSFGGAVVIEAGVSDRHVEAVAALSSQTLGTGRAGELSPRPLLLMHGTADEILPDACSREIFSRASEPKEILLYPGCRHGLDECRDEVDRDLLAWLEQVLALKS